MSESPFADLRGLPYYDEPILHLNMGGRLWAWEFDGWKPESMSWKTGCYIHTGLSNTQTNFVGPDVKEFFSSIAVNGFETFEIGSMKHSIYCNDDGLITAHAILQRNDEHEYRYYAGQPWPHYKLLTSGGRFDVQMQPVEAYLTQIAGPTSLETLERATGESLRDIGFLRFRDGDDRRQEGRGRPHRHVAATSPTRSAARSPRAPRSTTPSSRPARTSASSASAGGPTSSTTSRAASPR